MRMRTTTAEIVSAAETLPIEMRLEIVDRLLEGIGPTRKEIDDMWLVEIERRRENVRTGKSKMVPGDEVFAKVEKRFGR